MPRGGTGPDSAGFQLLAKPAVVGIRRPVTLTLDTNGTPPPELWWAECVEGPDVSRVGPVAPLATLELRFETAGGKEVRAIDRIDGGHIILGCARIKVIDDSRGGGADLESWVARIRAHEPVILSVIRSFFRAPEIREDVRQEIFVKLIRAFHEGKPQFASEAAFKAWLSKVTRNACNDVSRRRGRDRERPHDLTGGLEPIGRADHSAAMIEFVEVLESRLDPDKARIAILYYVCGNTLEEIAAMLGKSTTAVHGSLKKIRHDFGDEAPFP